MNKRILHGKWRQLRGAIREEWAHLTDDDMHLLLGKADRLVGILEERYGYTRKRAQQEVEEFLAKAGRRQPPVTRAPLQLRRQLGRPGLLIVAASLLLVGIGLIALRRLPFRFEIREYLESTLA